jgi:Arc/MetJ-type ribon-helix-helix transcriptional regulator
VEIPLDPEIEQVVRQKVEAGEYPSVAVLVEEALFLLVQRDWAARRAELDASKPFGPAIEPGQTSDELP